jgi:hypothetical protein
MQGRESSALGATNAICNRRGYGNLPHTAETTSFSGIFLNAQAIERWQKTSDTRPGLRCKIALFAIPAENP